METIRISDYSLRQDVLEAWLRYTFNDSTIVAEHRNAYYIFDLPDGSFTDALLDETDDLRDLSSWKPPPHPPRSKPPAALPLTTASSEDQDQNGSEPELEEPNKESDDLISQFLEYAQNSKVEGRDGNHAVAFYIPRSALERFWTPYRIFTILLACEPSIYESSKVIRRDYLCVFSILVYIRRPEEISRFVRFLLKDTQLPLTYSNSGFAQGPLKEPWYPLFEQSQWQFCPLKFSTLTTHKRQLESKQILPVTYEERLGERTIPRDRTSVWKVRIHDEYNDIVPKGTPVVFKTYGHEEVKRLYTKEVGVYMSLAQDSWEHIVKFYGTLSFEGLNKHIILLDYASKGTLLDLFTNASIPRNEEEIRLFWTRMLDLLKGLHILHNVPNVEGSIEDSQYRVHQDIQPRNILVFPGPSGSAYDLHFKLADFGMTLTGKVESNDRTTSSEGNRMYSAPECFHSFVGKDHLHGIIDPTSDIWALGAVFSEALVWTFWGDKGRETYRTRRKSELLDNDLIRGSGFGAGFHDGTDKLLAVETTHKEALRQRRLDDDVSHHISELILTDMLQKKEKRQPSASQTVRAARTKLFHVQEVVESLPERLPSSSQPVVLLVDDLFHPSGKSQFVSAHQEDLRTIDTSLSSAIPTYRSSNQIASTVPSSLSSGDDDWDQEVTSPQHMTSIEIDSSKPESSPQPVEESNDNPPITEILPDNMISTAQTVFEAPCSQEVEEFSAEITDLSKITGWSSKLWLWLASIYSPPPAGFKRLSYLCGCGEVSYVDVRELSRGGIDRFRQRLLNSISTVRRRSQGQDSLGNPTTPVKALLKPNNAALPSGGVPLQPLTQLPLSSSTHNTEKDTSLDKSAISSQDPQDQYLLLCINTKNSTALVHVDIGSLSNDQYLFTSIREHYEAIRKEHEWKILFLCPSWIRKLLGRFTAALSEFRSLLLLARLLFLPQLRTFVTELRFHRITRGDFVRFQLVPLGEDCCPMWFKAGQIPPETEVTAKRYLYEPVPMDDVELMDIPLQHLLKPGPHTDVFWKTTFPKKLKEQLVRKPGSDGQRVIGWGIRINEGLNGSAVLLLSLILLGVAGISVVVYAAVTSDNSTAFGLGSFLAAIVGVYITYQYFAWKEEVLNNG